MNKGRVEAFTDAIVAIILTIMVLEFHIPDGVKWDAMLENLPYLFAYAVTFLLIAASWYNHHYMLEVTQYFSKRAYWINNLWLFTMSIMPVSTGWVGKHLLSPAPEMFYYIVYGLWFASYFWLSIQLEHDAESRQVKGGQQIHEMSPFKILNSPWLIVLYLLGFGIIKLWPPFAILATLVLGISVAIGSNYDHRNLFS